MSLSTKLRAGWVRSMIVLRAAVKTMAEPIGLRELMLFAGSALVGYGAFAIYPPAAWIAPGLMLAGVAIFGVRS